MQVQLVANDSATLPDFDAPRIVRELRVLSKEAVDDLTFGVIGFDRRTVVQVYNRYESHAAGLSLERVLGKPFFDDVAPCLNNFLVAQRFLDAWASRQELDAIIDYVLTLRMRPVRVALRLVTHPDADISYVLVRRLVVAP